MVQNNIDEILVVDDAPDSVKLLTGILSSYGYSVYSVNSGEQAIERVKSIKPSIIFLDIMMPGMDGFDVCKYLKTQKETVDLPIIFISSLDDEQSILRGYELGGIDYIIKPFREKDVLAKVLPLLRVSGYMSKLKRHANALLDANKIIENEAVRKKSWSDYASEPFIHKSIQGENSNSGIAFDELFDISEIQKLQDQFAKAFGIASIVTLPDGTPVTKPSNFTHLCKNIIRSTETGVRNCMYSDSVIGRYHPKGPIVQTCLGCGLWDAGASITVGGTHVANWLIGQVRRETVDLDNIKSYAREIGANEQEFIDAYQRVPVMSEETISNISQLLFTMAGQLSQKAYQTVQQSRYINDRTNAEIALLKSEEKFRKIINSSPVGMIFCDLHADNKLILRGNNPSAEHILGIKGKKLIGKSFEEAFPELMNTEFPEIYSKVANREAETQTFEVEYNAHQVHRIFDVTVFRIGNNSIAVTFLDISERKLAEKALKESELKFRELAESINVAICTYQGERWTYTNPALERISGYSSEELKNLTILDFVAPDYRDAVGEVAKSRLSGKKNVGDYEMQIITKQGKRKWLYVSGSSIMLDKKSTALISGIDITQLKESEKLIKQSEELYRSIFQMSLAVMLLIDPETGKIIDANDAAVEFYGWPYRKLLKMNLSQINVLPIEDIKHEMQKALENNRNHFLFKHRIADGKVRDVEAYSSRILLNGRQMLFSIIHDVSEKKLMEDQLRQSEERFRKAIIEAPFPIMLHAEDEEVIAISKAWSDLSGYSHNEIPTTREWSIRAFGNENASVKKYIDKLYSADHWVNEGEFTILSKSGEPKIWDFGSAPLGHLSDGRRVVISMARDVSDRVRYEESIQKDRILLRTLIDNLPVAVYVKDKKCRKIIANTTDLDNIGLGAESMVVGKTDIELFGGEIGSRGYADDLQVIQSGQPVLNKEEMFINSNGKVRWMVTSKMPLFDEHNRIAGLVGIGRDVTEQKKEKELINKLTKSVEQSPSSLLITDTNGRIEYVNPQFIQMTGYTLEEVFGKTPRILKSGKTPDYIYRQLWSSLLGGDMWRGEFYNKKKNGEFYWEWVTITPLKDENGQITNFIAIHEDITLRKQMEADLIFAKEKAEESDRLKSAFLANMSHEIRTPLNSIIGFSELLADPYFDLGQRKEFINHIINNGNSLLTIISDIMDISKMESGQITLRNSLIDVNKLLSEINKQYLIISKAKDIEFIVEIPEEENSLMISVYTDSVRLRQVFDNLIGNALKFTMTGSIKVGYKCTPSIIQFFIKDTGIGIPKEFHSVVFDRFRQVELSLSRQYGGTGLGLAIVKILVEHMGGRIWLESEPNYGSTFYFTLPLSPT